MRKTKMTLEKDGEIGKIIEAYSATWRLVKTEEYRSGFFIWFLEEVL